MFTIIAMTIVIIVMMFVVTIIPFPITHGVVSLMMQ